MPRKSKKRVRGFRPELSEDVGQRTSFEGGALDRFFRAFTTRDEPGDPLSLTDRSYARQRSFYFYRNNPYFRKIVETAVDQVVGTGLKPRPMSESGALSSGVLSDGRWQKWSGWVCSVWERIQQITVNEPWNGGESLQSLQWLCLRESIVAGEIFLRRMVLTQAQADEYGLDIPLAYDLILSEQVPDDDSISPVVSGNRVRRGIEYRPDGRRAYYHVLRNHPNDYRNSFSQDQTIPIPASEIRHVYSRERPNQERGNPNLVAILTTCRDQKQFDESVRIGAAVAAAVALVYTGPGNARAKFGLNASDGELMTDGDGNKVSKLSPGLVMRAPQGSQVTPITPGASSSYAEGFSSLLARQMAVGSPGIKASTVTGDYRESSFSSERSADNDVWRSIERWQDWFAYNVCQPVLADLVDLYVALGRQEVVQRNVYWLNRSALLSMEWDGPVAKHLNPVDEITAAAIAISIGARSPQQVAASVGNRWDQVLEQVKLWSKVAEGIDWSSVGQGLLSNGNGFGGSGGGQGEQESNGQKDGKDGKGVEGTKRMQLFS